MTRKSLIFAMLLYTAIAVSVMLFTLTYAVAQGTDVVVQQPTTFEEWLPAAITTALAGVGIFIGMTLRYLVVQILALVPEVIRPVVKRYLDQKAQDALQKAILSAVSKIVLEGRWTSASAALDEIKDGVWASVKDTVDHFGLRKVGSAQTDAILERIASAKAIEAMKNVAVATDAVAKVQEVAAKVEVVGTDNLAEGLRKAVKGALPEALGGPLSGNRMPR